MHAMKDELIDGKNNHKNYTNDELNDEFFMLIHF